MKKEYRYEYTTANDQANYELMVALQDILFMKKMEKLMPFVAKELMRLGVDFSKAKR